MRVLIIFALVLAALGNPIRSFGQSANTNNSGKTADQYKPTYTGDTVIIRFMMKDSTTVWARLYDDPIAQKKTIEEINFDYKKAWELDWVELKSDLQILIADAYKNPNLKEVIETDINKQIEMQKNYLAEVKQR